MQTISLTGTRTFLLLIFQFLIPYSHYRGFTLDKMEFLLRLSNLLIIRYNAATIIINSFGRAKMTSSYFDPSAFFVH